MWGVLAVYGPHWVCHSSRQHVLPGSTLLRLQRALQGHCLKWALRFIHFPGLSPSGSHVLCKGIIMDWCAFCTLPRSEQFRWPGAWRAHCPGRPCILITPLVPATQGALREHHLSCAMLSPLGSWSQAATLLADVNHPGSHEDIVSNWKHAHSLVEDAVSGAETVAAPCLPALAVTCLPLGGWGEGACVQPASSPLEFVQSVVLWMGQAEH